MNGLLEREKKATIFQYHRVSELEEQIRLLKSTPLWKKFWDDIKPKPRYSYGYSGWYMWQEFMEKVFWVMIAVVYAMAVYAGTYCFMKYII